MKAQVLIKKKETLYTLIKNTQIVSLDRFIKAVKNTRGYLNNHDSFSNCDEYVCFEADGEPLQLDYFRKGVTSVINTNDISKSFESVTLSSYAYRWTDYNHKDTVVARNNNDGTVTVYYTPCARQ